MTEQDRRPALRVVSAEALAKELKRVDSGLRFARTLFQTLFLLVVVAAASVLVATLMFPVLRIYGASMEPALQEGEIVFSLRTTDIRRSDLVAFYYGNKVLIKRCIALPGDVVDLDDAGNVTVNGTLLEEPYLQEKARGDCDIDLPFQVPDGRLFVLGDQRSTSIDSRNSLIGCIASEQIIGRVVFRLWPLSRCGSLY